MAINIYQGGAMSKKGKANSASASSRAQNAKAALKVPAETSSTGSTAVGTQGTLGKVMGLVSKVADVGSHVPGLVGTISRVVGRVANSVNDPEWWQTIPGEGMSTNAPLKNVPIGTCKCDYKGTGTAVDVNVHHVRPAIGEITSLTSTTGFIMYVSPRMVSQYLMPEVRRVVNAVPLQNADDYRSCLRASATIYSMWRNLKKYDYMLKHGQTYIPNLNDPAYPVLQVENAAWLQATINRLEEFLRSNVRLPHTLCEYLAWRFGRVYKSAPSAKSGLILYNVIPLSSPLTDYEALILNCMKTISSTTERQQANTDLYNAYYDHDMMVDIPDTTQFMFDGKEWMLRINLNCPKPDTGAIESDTTLNPVCIDSALDNPTVFMASTVSTLQLNEDGNHQALFNCTQVNIYQVFGPLSDKFWTIPATTGAGNSANTAMDADFEKVNNSELWRVVHISEPTWITGISDEGGKASIVSPIIFLKLAAIKALDFYNMGFYLGCRDKMTDFNTTPENWVDITAISMDMGVVSDEVLETEQVYAFANLVSNEHKTAMTYKKAEKLVTKDVADFVESVPVATTGNS